MRVKRWLATPPVCILGIRDYAAGMTPEQAARLQAGFESHLQEFFAAERARLAHGEWLDPVYFDLAEYAGRKGKRVRPMILLMTYQAFGGTRPVEDRTLLRAAVALELLHTFVLIHDDIIDRSETRRGLPTFHRVCAQRAGAFEEGSERAGEGLALVMGDVAYAMAIRALADLELEPAMHRRVLDMFLEATVDTGLGELQDILFGLRDVAQVQAGEIAEMYHFKTTRYTFEAPCLLGAILAGAAEEKVRALPGVTRPLGLAFQIQNDLLECRFDDLAACADLLEGKKTMVVRAAYDRLDEIDRSFLQLCLGSARRSASTLAKLRDLIVKSGAIGAMRERAEELFVESQRALVDGPFTAEEARRLAEAIGLIRQRVRVA